MRPLLWKELRQGRPLVLFSLIAALALAGAHGVAGRMGSGLNGDGLPVGIGPTLDAAAGTLLVLLPLFLAVLAGSGLFAGEIDHGTVPVLLALPLSRRRIWVLKGAAGLLLTVVSCGLLLGVTRLLTPSLHLMLGLMVWPDLVLVPVTAFAIAVFATVLAPNVIGALLAAVALSIGLAIGAYTLESGHGAYLLGYGPILDCELWAALAVPALLFTSLRVVRRGELLQWNRSALLHLPVLAGGLVLTIAVVCGAGRALTGYSRPSVRQITAQPAPLGASTVMLLAQSRPVPYQRGLRTKRVDAEVVEHSPYWAPRPLDWADPTAGTMDAGPFYRNTSAVALDLKRGRELAVVREPLGTKELQSAVSADGRYAAVVRRRGGLTWGADSAEDRVVPELEIFDLQSGRRLYSGVPEPVLQPHVSQIATLAWSPRGEYLALTDSGRRVFLLRRDGSVIREAEALEGQGSWAWSPADDVIYFAQGLKLARLHPDTGKTETVWEWTYADMATLSVAPSALSPDGRRVALMSSRWRNGGRGEGADAVGVIIFGEPFGEPADSPGWHDASGTPRLVAVAWSRDSRTLYVLLSSLPVLDKSAPPPTAALLRWRVGEKAATELAAGLPYPNATLAPLPDGRLLIYPARVIEQKQYTLRNEPLPPTAGPAILDAAGKLHPFPDAAAALPFATDNQFVTIDDQGRLITIQGPPGKTVVAATEVGTGKSVRVYP